MMIDGKAVFRRDCLFWSAFRKQIFFAGTLFCLFFSGACTSVPFETSRPDEKALPPFQPVVNRLQTTFETDLVGNEVVLAPLGDGNDALGARLRMIEQAKRSIDIKTFLIKPDTAGALIWLALYNAAERGVRIRLLYDDVFTSASDAQIATLDAHTNVEIRTFNPLSRNSTRAVNFLLDFKRVNRRMHNKAFLVDGAAAIIGGRNIANEYFQIETKAEFADFDVFVAGASVKHLSDAFDIYWNDEWSVPIERFTTGDAEALSEASQALRETANTPEAQIFERAVKSTYLSDLRTGRSPFFRGTARVVVDQPQKLRKPPGIGPFDVGNAFYNTLLRAERDVLVITPYFVPETYGAEVFEALAARGVHVRIVTNSLASTNHAYVYGGYAKYRNRLLKSGIDVFEVRSDAPSILEGVDTPIVLHSKLAIVDGQTLFVSSTNVDPRSIRQNSEIATIIESPDLAQEILSRFNAEIGDYVFQVLQGPDGDPVWQYNGQKTKQKFTRAPNATVFMKLVAALAAWLPIEQQL